MKRYSVYALVVILTLLAGALSGCGATPTPEVIEVEKIVTEVVEQTIVETVVVESEVIVEKEVPVETEVEVEVVVTATPVPKGGTLTYGLLFSPSGFDPHINASWDLGVAVANVYDPLVYEDESGQIQPGLAESWEVSADGKSYTFHLREGVTFHDGNPFDAEAVKYSFDRIVNPDTKSQFARTMLGPYESSEVIDEHTIQVNFSEPFAFFLARLGLPYLAIVSPEAVEEWGEDYQFHQVGTGPFVFKEYIPQDHLTLVRNPDYNWPPAYGLHTGPAYLEEVVFEFLPDSATRGPALEAGDVDVAREMLPEQASRLGQHPDFSLLATAMTGQTMEFFMNTEREPTNDLKVRQALLYATDPTVSANTIFRGYFPPAYGPLSSITFDYNPAVEDLYPYDPTKAAALLDEAGWVDSDGDGIRDKDGQPLVLEMIVQGWGHLEQLGQIVQGQLRQVGIDVQMEMMSYPAALQAASDGTYHLTPYGGGGWDAGVLDGFFKSGAFFNWSKVASEELDSILVAASQELDPDARKELYGQAQQYIMEEALILPVLSEGQLVGINNRVQGLSYDPMGLWPRFYDAYAED
jgi:peptide/nickel transport system substrate-binding protein